MFLFSSNLLTSNQFFITPDSRHYSALTVFLTMPHVCAFSTRGHPLKNIEVAITRIHSISEGKGRPQSGLRNVELSDPK